MAACSCGPSPAERVDEHGRLAEGARTRRPAAGLRRGPVRCGAHAQPARVAAHRSGGSATGGRVASPAAGGAGGGAPRDHGARQQQRVGDRRRARGDHPRLPRAPPEGRRAGLRRAHTGLVRRDASPRCSRCATPGVEARHHLLPPPPAPPTLSALDESTRERLRILAERSLDALGVRERGPFVESEMLRLFGELAADAGNGADREARLRAAIARALAEVD